MTNKEWLFSHEDYKIVSVIMSLAIKSDRIYFGDRVKQVEYICNWLRSDHYSE